MFDSGCAGGVAMAAASGMRAAGRSRVRWQCPAAGASSTAPARAPPGASRAWKRWPALNFRGCGGSRAHEEWRHCATSGREGCGTGGERYALATFFVSPDCPPPARPRSAVEEAGENHRRTGELARAPPHRGTRPADPRPLRPFPSATPLDPSLYEKRERSEGRRSAAEGKRRSRRPGAATSCPAACRRPGPGPTSHRAVAPGRHTRPSRSPSQSTSSASAADHTAHPCPGDLPRLPGDEPRGAPDPGR